MCKRSAPAYQTEWCRILEWYSLSYCSSVCVDELKKTTESLRTNLSSGTLLALPVPDTK